MNDTNPDVNTRALPDFYDDAHKENHNALIEAGYRYYGWDVMEKAYLYQKRVREAEVNNDCDKCCFNFWQHDMREYRLVTNPITYEAGLFYNSPAGYAGELKLYSLHGQKVADMISALETEMLSVWLQFAKNARRIPDAEVVNIWKDSICR